MSNAQPGTLPLALAVALAAAGCAALRQDPSTALVRKPGEPSYGDAVLVSSLAGDRNGGLWEDAVLSFNVYAGEWVKDAAGGLQPSPIVSSMESTDPTWQLGCSRRVDRRNMPLQQRPRLPLPDGWTRWDDFPDQETRRDAQRVGLYLEVWEKAAEPPRVVVAIRGTDFTSLPDWLSNLRWVRLSRLLAGYQDQYTVISRSVARQLVERLAGDSRYGQVEVGTTGHSLGGGLAQQLAYTLPPVSFRERPIRRIAHLRVFNPSPVTGWFSVRKNRREANASDLFTDRIFEHGEILAYVRLLLGYVVPPSSKAPEIQQTRFNFICSRNVVDSHAMRVMACGLAAAAGASPYTSPHNCRHSKPREEIAPAAQWGGS